MSHAQPLPESAAPRRGGPVREFGHGAGALVQGFGFWGRRPGVMALGLLPGAIVGTGLLIALGALAASLPGLVEALTPFADRWPGVWASLVRIAAGAALLGGGLVVAVVSFTALTLTVGDPFYERVWRAVEADLGGAPVAAESGFWRSVADGLSLLLRGLVAAVLAALLGLVPGVGGVLSAAAAIAMTGWLLADELTSRALIARGIRRAERRRLRRAHRARTWGFGIATQLCFLVPGGAVAVMPAAVAGATVLARSLLPDSGEGAAPSARSSVTLNG